MLGQTIEPLHACYRSLAHKTHRNPFNMHLKINVNNIAPIALKVPLFPQIARDKIIFKHQQVTHNLKSMHDTLKSK